MPLIEWCDEISTGIKSIDEEHKVLINLVNALYDAIQLEKEKDVLGEILNGLVLYIVVHFTHEEEFMFATHYPGFAEHVAEHDRLRDQVMRLQNEFQKSANNALANETLAFLKGWIKGHIMYCDKLFAPHFKENGII
jgi:hemerythrin